jgi:hypothetical protein
LVSSSFPQGSVRGAAAGGVFFLSPIGMVGWHGRGATIGPSGWVGWVIA